MHRLGFMEDFVCETRKSGIIAYVYRLSDIRLLDLSKYKLVVFAYTFEISDEDKKYLDESFKNGMYVEMEIFEEALDEVMVIAYGTQKRSAFTGSASIVGTEEIGKVQATNFADALKGKASGVQITTASGQPGSTPSIRIRGFNSLNAGMDPLIVVDGVPFEGSLNDINTQDIESIVVQKDAASSALYGARGGNGVIMVTTKTAKKGQDAKITFDAKWGSNTKGGRNYNRITNPAAYYEAYYQKLKNYAMATQVQGAANGLGYNEVDAWKWANENLINSTEFGLRYNVFTQPEGQYLIGLNGKLNPNATLGRVVVGADGKSKVDLKNINSEKLDKIRDVDTHEKAILASISDLKNILYTTAKEQKSLSEYAIGVQEYIDMTVAESIQNLPDNLLNIIDLLNVLVGLFGMKAIMDIVGGLFDLGKEMWKLLKKGPRALWQYGKKIFDKLRKNPRAPRTQKPPRQPGRVQQFFQKVSSKASRLAQRAAVISRYTKMATIAKVTKIRKVIKEAAVKTAKVSAKAAKPIVQTVSKVAKPVAKTVSTVAKGAKTAFAAAKTGVKAMPKWLSKIAKIIGKVGKVVSKLGPVISIIIDGLMAITAVWDYMTNKEEILTGDGTLKEKAKALNEAKKTRNSQLGGAIGGLVGTAAYAIPYVGWLVGPIVQLALGYLGEWLGEFFTQDVSETEKEIKEFYEEKGIKIDANGNPISDDGKNLTTNTSTDGKTEPLCNLNHLATNIKNIEATVGEIRNNIAHLNPKLREEMKVSAGKSKLSSPIKVSEFSINVSGNIKLTGVKNIDVNRLIKNQSFQRDFSKLVSKKISAKVNNKVSV